MDCTPNFLPSENTAHNGRRMEAFLRVPYEAVLFHKAISISMKPVKIKQTTQTNKKTHQFLEFHGLDFFSEKSTYTAATQYVCYICRSNYKQAGKYEYYYPLMAKFKDFTRLPDICLDIQQPHDLQ